MFKRKSSLALMLVLLLLALPYYIFGGKLFIGGDDTRLFYIFPIEWIKNIALYSWVNFTSVGLNSPNQSIIPSLLLWSWIGKLVQSKIVLDYLAFSLPMVVGFFYFQKMVKLFLEKETENISWVAPIGSLFYVLSPIVLVGSYLNFLYAVWLLALFPTLSYYYVKYITTSKIIYLVCAIVIQYIFSIALTSIPWILGLLLPVIIGLVLSAALYTKSEVWVFCKRSLVFVFVSALSQAYWLLPFSLNFLTSSSSSFASSALSKQVSDSFSSTVIPTATGNILYPLLDLFHRQIAFTYEWSLMHQYLTFFDRIVFLNLIFPALLLVGILYFRKHLYKKQQKLFVLFLATFVISLFLFTVNIGPFKYLFLSFGHIPGFAMFRNFYDKFAIGYIFIYSIVIVFSLLVASKKFPKYVKLINILTIFVIILNFVPVKPIVNKPLWTTQNIYNVITIPDEYLDFMKEVKLIADPTSGILSLPFNIAGYTFIKDAGSNNIFAGRSPVQLFTGINDFSGSLSFSASENARINSDIQRRNYSDLNSFLAKYNIDYIFVTNNIPSDVKKSYLFDRNILNQQDSDLLKAITGKAIVVSKNGNYVLYEAKRHSYLIESTNITFAKVNPVTYKIYISNLNKKQKLLFKDSYNKGWNLFLNENPNTLWCSESKFQTELTKECKYQESFFSITDLGYTLMAQIFGKSHVMEDKFSNQWTIDPKIVKNNYDKKYYTVNPDGSINIELTLYFVPQNYFYMGIAISFATLVGIMVYFLYKKRYGKNN